MNLRHIKVAVLVIASFCSDSGELSAEETPHPLHHINTAFENASPLWWEVDADGVVHVHLVYDQERQAPNRANGHWNFRIDARTGSGSDDHAGPVRQHLQWQTRHRGSRTGNDFRLG